MSSCRSARTVASRDSARLRSCGRLQHDVSEVARRCAAGGEELGGGVEQVGGVVPAGLEPAGDGAVQPYEVVGECRRCGDGVEGGVVEVAQLPVGAGERAHGRRVVGDVGEDSWLGRQR